MSLSLNARTPLGTCLGFNTVDNGMSLQRACDRKQECKAQVQHQEDERSILALEIAGCPRQCGWRSCPAVLGSWELLKKHVERIHCEDLSLGEASSSRPYRCHYAACQNRIFSFPSLLLEHIVTSHLEQLKLCCPLGCKQASTRLQSLVHHLESVHDMTVFELCSTQIQRPPPRQEPLPELPTYAPTYLVGSLQVILSPSFDPSKTLVTAQSVDSSEGRWDDFAHLDGPDEAEMEPFVQLRWPVAGEERARVRTIPRTFGEKDDGGNQHVTQEEVEDSDESSEDGPKIGFAYWKRRFERDRKREERRNSGH